MHTDAIRSPLDVLTPETGWGDARCQVRCPNGCWDDASVQYVHPGELVQGEEENTSPTGERGWWMRLPFWCEGCDGEFSLIVAFHKGQTFVSMVRGDGPDERD